MSLLAVQGGATGTGTVTLLAPITNTNRTLTLPDVTDTVAGIAATQTLTNKTLTSPTLTTPNIDSAQFATVSGTAPIYPCRAWVNFNGTGTVAIRASGNVSSITDNGTGDYTVNFTTAMPDANYTAVGNCTTNNAFGVQAVVMFNSAVSNANVAPTAAAYRLSTRENGGPGRDEEYVITSVFR
jgi:hypothetical protein